VHWRDGERHGSTHCPLVWLRDFCQEHRAHLAQYEPALVKVGWDRAKPIEQWGAYLLQAVQVERGSALAQARALAMRAATERPAGRLLLCGPRGTAKTMLATGLLLSWLAHSGRACAFVPWGRIEALAELSTSQRVSEIERLRALRVIVLDDAARGGARLAGESGTEDDGRIAWTTTVEPYVAPDAAQTAAGPQPVSPTQLNRIRVEVRYPGAGGRERTLALSTLKLARREGGP